jgi:hypothetical protein
MLRKILKTICLASLTLSYSQLWAVTQLPQCKEDGSIDICYAANLQWTRNSVYSGSVVNGYAQGEGVMVFLSGDVFAGKFERINDDKITGEGIYRSAQWVYEGRLRLGKFEGRGILRFKDGRPPMNGWWAEGNLIKEAR